MKKQPKKEKKEVWWVIKHTKREQSWLCPHFARHEKRECIRHFQADRIEWGEGNHTWAVWRKAGFSCVKIIVTEA